MKRKSILLTAISIAVVCVSLLLIGCEKQDEITYNDLREEYPNDRYEEEPTKWDGTYDYLYETGYISGGMLGLSQDDLTSMHNLVANIHQQKDEWSRSLWDDEVDEMYGNYLPKSLFSNNGVKMKATEELYVSVLRFDEPFDYSKNLTSSIKLNFDKFYEENGIYVFQVLVDMQEPVHSDGFKPNLDRSEYYSFREDSEGWKIVNMTRYGPESTTRIEPFMEKFAYEYTNTDFEKDDLNFRSSEYVEEEFYQFIDGEIPATYFLKYRYVPHSNEETISMKRASSNAYERGLAVWYAHRYAKNYNSSYKSFGLDCANFVSQCLAMGGFVNDYSGTDNYKWYYYSPSPASGTSHDQNSLSWSTAHTLKNYLSYGKYAEEVSEDDLWYGRNVQIGDVFFSNWYDEEKGKPNNSWDHAMIITKISGNSVYYSAHSDDRLDKKMSDVYRYKSTWFNYHHTKGYHIVKTNRGYIV